MSQDLNSREAGALWVDFAQQLGVLVIFVHTGVVVLILILAMLNEDAAIQNGLWDMLRLCVPVFGAYITSILTWFGQLRQSKRRITTYQRIAFSVPLLAVSFLLLMTPLVFVLNSNLEAGFAKNVFTAVELSFGAALATIARIFFGHADPGDITVTPATP